MDAEQFRKLSEAFDELAPLPPAQRRLLMDQRYAEHPGFRSELESLLSEHDRADAPVATAAGLEVTSLEPTPSSIVGWSTDGEPVPVLKGAYRLLRVIGEGGMGVVYEAEQTFPRRRVALKSIRPGFSSPAMVRRFKTEVELLARLHHPGIAHIHEAGFADENSPDQAFFVMELVDGMPLTKFATARKMTTSERLELMLKICDAVQHAHQRGVIHRDLKPANILVTAQEQPKILDFGIARAADDAGDGTLATRAGQVIGTPSYMSPEQIAGEQVDTRSDVYALGVIAFELLTGELPYDFAKVSVVEAARVLRERGTPLLSNTNRAFRGDLEVIVATAMHTERERRYVSAADMAEDIRRFLENRPIGARRDSAFYVLGKLARRHVALVSLGAAMLLAIVAFAVTASAMAAKNARLARESTKARTTAERESERSSELSRTLATELAASRVERGRAEAAAGKLKLAEDTLWDEYLTDPRPAAWWGLWELYYRMPCLWTKRVDAFPDATAVAGDGGMIASAIRPGTIVVRNGELTGIERRIESLGSPARCIAVSRDGCIAAGLANGKVILIEPGATSFRALGDAVAHAGGATMIAFSGDGKVLATGGVDKRIAVWSIPKGELLESWLAHEDSLFVLAINEDGSMLASAARPAVSARVIWKRGATLERLAIDHPSLEGVTSLKFLRDGRTLCVGHGGTETGAGYALSLVRDGTPELLLSGLGARVNGIEEGPDGNLAILSGQTLLIAATRKSAPVRTLGQQQGTLLSCGWRGDGRLLIVSDIGEARLFDASVQPAETRLSGYKSWCFSATWSPDGSRLALDGGGVETAVYSVRGFAYRGGAKLQPPARQRAMQFLSDSKTVITGSVDGRLRIIDAENGSLTRVLGKPRPEIYSLAVMPDQQTVVVGHADGVVRLWDLAAGEVAKELPKLERRIEGMCLSPDGKVLATSGLESGVRLWDTSDWKTIERIATNAMPWGVVFSTDGKLLFVSTYSGTVEVFDVAMRQRRAELGGHQRLIPGIAVSPDGKLFATGSEDSTVRLWDAATLRPIVTFETGSAEVVSLAFDPSSRYLSAASSARTVVVYDLAAMNPCIDGNRPFHEARRSAAK